MNSDTKAASDAQGGVMAWLIWLIAGLSFGYAFFHRVAPSVMVSDLMMEFTIGGAMLGTLSALYFYPYVLLQVPLGALLQGFGTRLLLSGALALAAAGSFLFGIADSLWLAYFARILIGIGCSVGFLGSLALATQWHPPHRYALLAGLSMFMGMMSGMLAQKPLAFLIELAGWRHTMFMLAIAGLGFAVLVGVCVRNSPDDFSKQKTHHKGGKSSVDWAGLWRDLNIVLKRRDVWKIAFVAAAMSGPMLTLGALWGTPYAMQAYGLSRPDAAFQMSWLLLGWAAGAPFWGWFCARIGRLKLVLVVNMLLLCIWLAGIIFIASLSASLFTIIAFLIGFTGGAMTACFGLVRQNMPALYVGAATGVVNSLTVASGAVLQPLVGLGLDLLWSGSDLSGTPAYQASDYRLAFSVILISCLAGLGVAIFLEKEKSGQSDSISKKA